jgi:hypothetical protein
MQRPSGGGIRIDNASEEKQELFEQHQREPSVEQELS